MIGGWMTYLDTHLMVSHLAKPGLSHRIKTPTTLILLNYKLGHVAPSPKVLRVHVGF